jgi:hypothetical protein
MSSAGGDFPPEGDRDMHTTKRPGSEYKLSASTAAQLRALDTMSVGELAEQFRTLFQVPTRSRNKAYLRKRIAWRIQELAFGGLPPRALEQIEALAPRAPVRWQPAASALAETPALPAPAGRDPRLPPPGATLSRLYDGTLHTVTVLEGGFEYAGKQFRSLSQIAKRITGTPWNGLLFFNLTKRRAERAS